MYQCPKFIFIFSALFPDEGISFQEPFFKPSPKSIKWINKKLNERQRCAVLNVLKAECRPSPYIIFGPPGTGKTMTIVEAMLQIFQNVKNSRIVACAPSNACADLIALKLIASKKVTPYDMARQLGRHRLENYPIELEGFVCEAGQSDKLKQRIIVSTIGSVGHLLEMKKKSGWFTHVFLDEAAQATEPETLQLLSLVSGGSGVSVLVGDPYQLGPICISPEAKRLGLGKPLMNRLFDMVPYRRNDRFAESGRYNPMCITKLVESYRCCSDLIYVNSKLFYCSELDCVPQRDLELMKLLNIDFPVIFEGMHPSIDEREPDSSSWFNVKEVLRCTMYLKKLYQVGLTPDDVGIITPYRKQMEKIRDFIRDSGMLPCKVATVEEFQGGERKAIIVSLVRTSKANIKSDIQKQLGFIFNEKRFNVSTTRAKSLLVVIGDPFCLVADDCWKTFISYCLAKDSYTGCKFTLDDVHAPQSDVEEEEEETTKPTKVEETNNW